jgi:acetoin utilization protein AcuB
MLVESIMTRDVITLTQTMSVQDALDISKQHRIRHLPVVQDDYLVGLVSDRDLRDATPSTLETCQHDLLRQTKVEKIMVKEVHTCHPLDFVEDAAAQMYRHRIGCLPVVSQGRLVGIISERDILHTLVEMMGVNTPTSRVEVEVPDRPGMLAEIADLLRARRTNTSTVLVFPSPIEGCKRLVFRINTMDPRRFIQDIHNAGYRVVNPPCATGPSEE